MTASLFLLLVAIVTVPFSVAFAEGTSKLSHYRSAKRFSKYHECKPPPCENPYDFLGLLKIIIATRHLLKKTAIANATELFQKLGETYSSIIFGEKVVFTCNPLNIKQVLVTRFVDFDSSVVRAHVFRPITEHGIFAVDGQEWKAARDVYRNVFSNTRTIFDVDIQEKHFQAFLGQIRQINKPYNLQPLFLNLILDLTTAFALGDSVDSLSSSQPSDKKAFVDSLLYVKKTMARDGFLGPVSMLLSRRDFYHGCEDVKRYVESYIFASLRKKQHLEGENPDQVENIARRFNLLDELAQDNENIVNLRDGVITVLIAGIDSVAGLLSTTFWLLARHPQTFEKLRESILEHIGQDPPTYDQLRNFPYLRHVLNEAMRVYPPVPFNARVANKETVLPYGGGPNGASNVFIQKGQKVVFSTWATHRSPRLFGDRADEFCPERWEHLKGEALGFIPFNSGPRACPGQQYALMEASYITVRLLQSFSSVKNCDSRGWREKLGLNLFNDNGVIVHFEE
ncbi:hypothetical protein ACLMJK_002225 [Lecanora helva]